MAGCFGLKDDYHHDHVPAERLVSHWPALDVHAPAIAARIRDEDCRTQNGPAGILEVDGQPISVGWHKSLPLRVWICDCGRACYRLHQVNGRWACRRCHRLDYSSRHRGRTIPGYTRAVYLRRRMRAYGVSGELFSPITPRPLSHRRFWRLLVELRDLEARIARYLGANVNDVLERRHAKRRKRG